MRVDTVGYMCKHLVPAYLRTFQVFAQLNKTLGFCTFE